MGYLLCAILTQSFERFLEKCGITDSINDCCDSLAKGCFLHLWRYIPCDVDHALCGFSRCLDRNGAVEAGKLYCRGAYRSRGSFDRPSVRSHACKSIAGREATEDHDKVSLSDSAPSKHCGCGEKSNSACCSLGERQAGRHLGQVVRIDDNVLRMCTVSIKSIRAPSTPNFGSLPGLRSINHNTCKVASGCAW